MSILNKKVSIGTAVLSAVSLKLCCWGPFLLIGVAGISGGSVYFSWLDTVKPYLLILAFLSLAFGFYQVYKPINKDNCDSCKSKNKSIYRSKVYIWLVTLFVVSMTLVSYYPQLFYRSTQKNIVVVDNSNIQKVNISIEGITCFSCEENINHSVGKLNGILHVETSRKKGTSEIEFDRSKTNLKEIKKTIESKGYIINENNKK
jgi:mercuric ion transport protein